MQRVLALSLLQVYADIACNAHGAGVSKPFYLFIDEPEICLHPSGQQRLLDALMIISKKKQIFLTTHSPFLLSSPHLKHVGLFIFKKDNNKSHVEKASTSPLFAWSPSWGEINYNAYNLAYTMSFMVFCRIKVISILKVNLTSGCALRGREIQKMDKRKERGCTTTF